MNIYYYLVREKTKQLFNVETSGLFLLRLLLVLTSIFYGLIVAFLLNILPMGINKTLDITHSIIILFILFRNILPVYSSKKRIIPPYYPVSSFKRILIELIDVIYSPLTIYLIVFMLSFSLSPLYNLYEITITLLIIINSFLLELVLKKILDEDCKNKFFYLAITVFLVVLFSFIIVTCELRILLMLLLMYMALLLNFNWYLEGKTTLKFTTINLVNKTTGNSKLIIFFKLIFLKKSIKVSLLVAIAFKLLIIGSNVLVYSRKGELLFNSEALFYMFIFPIIYFTYVFNNYFGYNGEFWLLFHIRQNIKGLILFYISPLLLLLLLDFIIAVPPLILIDKFNILFVTKYLLITILLVMNGFISSLLLPKKINTEFSFSSLKNNTSTFFSIISMAFVVILFLDSMMVQLFLFLIIFIIQILIFIIMLRNKYSSINYSFFKKIIH